MPFVLLYRVDGKKKLEPRIAVEQKWQAANVLTYLAAAAANPGGGTTPQWQTVNPGGGTTPQWQTLAAAQLSGD